MTCHHRDLSLAATVAVLALTLAACSESTEPGGGDDGGGSGGDVQSVTTRFESAAAIALADGTLRYDLPEKGLEDEACGGGRIVCLTPDNLSGRIYSGSFMVGGLDRGQPGYALTTVGHSAEVRHRPDLGRGGVMTFDINESTDFSGDYSCCGGDIDYPEGDLAVISRIELNFDYLDVTFTVPQEAGPAVAGQTYVIRQVYVDEATAPDVDGTMSVGDKLIRRADEATFRWYDTEHDSHAQRPASPVQAPNIELPRDEHGNPHYATFAVPLQDQDMLPFSREEAEQGNWLIRVLFDLSDGAVFELDDWAEADEEWDLIRAFHLLGNVGDANASVRVQMQKEQLADGEGNQNTGGPDDGEGDGEDDGGDEGDPGL